MYFYPTCFCLFSFPFLLVLVIFYVYCFLNFHVNFFTIFRYWFFDFDFSSIYFLFVFLDWWILVTKESLSILWLKYWFWHFLTIFYHRSLYWERVLCDFISHFSFSSNLKFPLTKQLHCSKNYNLLTQYNSSCLLFLLRVF